MDFNIVFLLLVVIYTVHPDMFLITIVSVNVKPIEVKHDVKSDEVNNDVQPKEVNDDVKPGARSVVVKVDVHAQFTNKDLFTICEHML